jgi:hypothetical protein
MRRKRTDRMSDTPGNDGRRGIQPKSRFMISKDYALSNRDNLLVYRPIARLSTAAMSAD